VIEALATLAWDGRRASFFRAELLAALKILDHGDVAAASMTGSYAGAMGQPQFMPSSYLRYAVDFEGHGRRDIWTSKADVLGSIANYLAQFGWRNGESWGQAVAAPLGLNAPGREDKRTLLQWAAQGVRPISGSWAAPGGTLAGLVAPDGAGGQTFVVFGNFAAIRHYNPSDYYAIAVGLIGDQVTT
jgi:membrane-bound lytic murein transglycosylase B